MAIKVLKSGVAPLESKWEKFLPNLENLQCGSSYAKKIGMLSAYLFSQLTEIQTETDCQIVDDGFGWKVLVTPDNERLSLTIGIVIADSQAVCGYVRGNSQQDQVSQDGLDLIGSRAYGANSIDEKLPPEFWHLRIKSAQFAPEVAWEETSEEYSRVIMPVLLVELEENALCAIRHDMIDNPTFKMQVAINYLQSE